MRKVALTLHVSTSVGWFGAVATFVGLSVIALTSDDAHVVRSTYRVMEPTAWYVLLPLALTSLLTGLVQALGTAWGLLQHYWVLFKLLINIFATCVLLLYMQTFASLARVAADPSADLDEVRSLSPVLHAGLALILLLVATTLAVLKPRGRTPYGERRRRRSPSVDVM